MKAMLVACGTAIVVALAVSACGDDKNDDTKGEAKPVPTATNGGTDVTAEKPAVYNSSGCGGCHGPDGEGKGSNPALKGTSLTEADFKAIVRTGKGTMPKFDSGTLSDTDLAAIYAWAKK